jgi:hypothetical protein
MSAGVVVHDRTKALLLLAGSRYDVYAPGPKVGQAFKHGKAAATKKELCLRCDGDGVVKDKFGRESACESCRGRGWHKVDPMLNKEHQDSWEVQAQESAGTRRVDCDRCAGKGVVPSGAATADELDDGAERWTIDRLGLSADRPLETRLYHTEEAADGHERCVACDGSGKVSVPIVRAELSDDDRVAEGVLNDWDRMMLRREQAGSYAEYDKCVAELARRSPHRHRVFHEVHVVKTASAGMLSGTQATELRRAVSQLLDWMPHEIVVPREIVEAEKRLSKPVKGRGVSKAQLGDRDAEIAARYEEGVRTPELAVEYGLSESQVQRILNKTAA